MDASFKLGRLDRSLAPVVCDLQINWVIWVIVPQPQQQFDYLQVAIRGRPVESGAPIFILHVDVSSTVEEKFHNGGTGRVLVSHCLDEGRPATVEVGSMVNK